MSFSCILVPGFPAGLSGPELMDRMREQSLKFGTDIRTETISKADLSARPFKLWVEGTEEDPKAAILADSVIIAT